MIVVDESTDVERRDDSRRKSLLTGIITHRNGGFASDCAIRQFSDNGARIAVPKGLPLPPAVYLIVLRTGIAHQAQVVWYKGAQAGLKLIAAIDLNSTTDRQFDLLREI